MPNVVLTFLHHKKLQLIIQSEYSSVLSELEPDEYEFVEFIEDISLYEIYEGLVEYNKFIDYYEKFDYYKIMKESKNTTINTKNKLINWLNITSKDKLKNSIIFNIEKFKNNDITGLIKLNDINLINFYINYYKQHDKYKYDSFNNTLISLMPYLFSKNLKYEHLLIPLISLNHIKFSNILYFYSIAVKTNNMNLFKTLNSNENFKITPEMSFKLSCLHGNLEMAQYFYDFVEKYNHMYNYLGCVSGNLKLVEWLYTKNSNFNFDKTFYRRIIFDSNFEIIDWLYSIKSKFNDLINNKSDNFINEICRCSIVLDNVDIFTWCCKINKNLEDIYNIKKVNEISQRYKDIKKNKIINFLKRPDYDDHYDHYGKYMAHLISIDDSIVENINVTNDFIPKKLSRTTLEDFSDDFDVAYMDICCYGSYRMKKTYLYVEIGDDKILRLDYTQTEDEEDEEEEEEDEEDN
jgi:hypothetical protein